MDAELLEIAEKVSSAFSNKDIASLGEPYHDNAEVWHNYDGKSLSIQQAFERVVGVFNAFDQVGLRNVRLQQIETGYVQQHDYVFTRDGETLAIPACQIVTVEDGKIRRTEAYLDRAPLNAKLSGQ